MFGQDIERNMSEYMKAFNDVMIYGTGVVEEKAGVVRRIPPWDIILEPTISRKAIAVGFDLIKTM